MRLLLTAYSVASAIVGDAGSESGSSYGWTDLLCAARPPAVLKCLGSLGTEVEGWSS